MISVSTQTTSNSYKLRKQLNKLKIACSVVTELIRDKIEAELLFKMTGAKFDEAALAAYPFLSDTKKFVYDYATCFSISYDHDSYTLSVDANELEARNFPANIMQILEYGNQLVQPYPHVHTILRNSKSLGLEALKLA